MRKYITTSLLLLPCVLVLGQCPSSIASLGVGNGLQVCWNNNEAPVILDDIKYYDITYAGNFVNGGSGDCWRTSQAATLGVNGNHQIEFKIGNTDWVCAALDGEVDTEPINMPVSYAYIDVRATHNGALIEWQTKKEKENVLFYIERSSDGIDFYSVATVEAENKPSVYQYKDDHLPAGQWYYRLQQVDVDGLVNYSSIQSFRSIKATDNFFALYPSPASEYITIDFKQRLELFTVKIYALSGHLVYQNTFNETDGTSLTLNLTEWHNGCYIIECSNVSASMRRKFIKL